MTMPGFTAEASFARTTGVWKTEAFAPAAGSRGAGGAAILLLQSGQQLLHVLCLRSRLRLLVHDPPPYSSRGVTTHPRNRSAAQR